jgi:hypothetical protein
MNAKEKADELVKRYINLYPHPTEEYLDIDESKQCALIAVDEILNTIEQIFETFEERKYWQEVKQEIQKL